jgi:streptogramin lyase
MIKKLLQLPIVLTLVLLVSQTSAHAAMALTHTEFAMPDGISQPRNIIEGSDGNMWFWATKTGDKVYGKVTPDGAITTYDAPSNLLLPVFHAVGSDGNLWFTDTDDAVGYVTPDGGLQRYSRPFDSTPTSMTVDQSGNLWFTERRSHKINYIVPGQPIVTFGAVPLSGPSGIVLGPDGKVWFLEAFGNKIKSVTSDGTITEIINLSTYGTSPSGLAINPSDGQALVTMASNGKVVKVSAAGTASAYDLLQNDGISLSVAERGPDNKLWYTDANADGYGYMDTNWNFVNMNTDKKIQSFASQCDRLWYTSSVTGVVGYISGIVSDMDCPWSPEGGGGSSGGNIGGAGAGSDNAILPPSTGYAQVSSSNSLILLYAVLLCGTLGAGTYLYARYSHKR